MTETLTYKAMGTTDDVTACEHCGKPELKMTVRMIAVDADGNEDGETYMGVTCAARMTGRKATDIRTEANRADRAALNAKIEAWNKWNDSHTIWLCNTRDKAIGKGARPAECVAYLRTDQFAALEAQWKAENPAPPNPWDK